MSASSSPFSSLEVSADYLHSGKAKERGQRRVVCEESGIIKLGFHQYHKHHVQVDQDERRRGEHHGKEKGLPLEPAVTGPTVEVSRLNESLLFS